MLRMSRRTLRLFLTGGALYDRLSGNDDGYLRRRRRTPLKSVTTRASVAHVIE
jgi:hypothetical protein